jgi:hypothetical protein
MKTFIHKIMAITMACVVIFTTMSFTVDMHYCGDTLVDVAVFQEAKDCGMQMAMSGSTSNEMKGMSCCHDKQIISVGQDDLKPTFQQLDLEQHDFVVAFCTSYVQLFAHSEAQEIPFNGYPPPYIVTDIVVLNEQFLI